jgi:very-short-patch-repair endonuclease
MRGGAGTNVPTMPGDQRTGGGVLQSPRPALSPDVQVAQRAAEEWGVVSLDELCACGLTKQGVAVRAANGRLHRLYRGVYAVGHANPPLEGRFLAAVKACGPGALLSHYSAGALWRIVEWDDRYLEVTVRGVTRRLHRGLRVHRALTLESRDATRHEGIPVTTPARTLLDLAATLDPRSLRRAVRRAQAIHLTSVRQLREVLTTAGPRRGVRNLARIIATGPAPTRTELEDAVLDLILRGGLAHPRVNAPMVVAGRRVIPDFHWPDQQLIVEADGAAWHDGEIAREDDAERQALLEAAGKRVLRVTWKQAIGEPARTLERIRSAGAPPASPTASWSA